MVDLQEGVHSQAGVDEDDGVLPPLQTTHLTLEPQTGSCAAVLLTHTHSHIGVSCDSAVGAPCCGGSPASAGRSLWTPAPYDSSSGCVPPSLYLWLDPHLHWCSWLETADSDTHTHTQTQCRPGYAWGRGQSVWGHGQPTTTPSGLISMSVVQLMGPSVSKLVM